MKDLQQKNAQKHHLSKDTAYSKTTPVLVLKQDKPPYLSRPDRNAKNAAEKQDRRRRW
jgi:hypothetical protein